LTLPVKKNSRFQVDGRTLERQPYTSDHGHNSTLRFVPGSEKAPEKFPFCPAKARMVTNIGQMLTGIPQLRKYAQYYPATEAMKLAGKVMADNQRVGNVCWLLEQETDILEGARSAFSSMRNVGNQRLGDAMDNLALATMKLVETFNSKLSRIFDTSNVLRYLGPLILQTAIEGMYPGKAPKNVNAVLDVAVLNAGVLKTGGLTDPQSDPTDSQTLLRQRISNLD